MSYFLDLQNLHRSKLSDVTEIMDRLFVSIHKSSDCYKLWEFLEKGFVRHIVIHNTLCVYVMLLFETATNGSTSRSSGSGEILFLLLRLK